MELISLINAGVVVRVTSQHSFHFIHLFAPVVYEPECSPNGPLNTFREPTGEALLRELSLARPELLVWLRPYILVLKIKGVPEKLFSKLQKSSDLFEKASLKTFELCSAHRC